jgi:hypothetical protein
MLESERARGREREIERRGGVGGGERERGETRERVRENGVRQ